ncbi:Vps5 C terminal like-domain-containing protein [Pisolithus orientalis]|uniref:Vps5 C terminal like-domain-containing protein n=1 Tax=Pisolithus orientalis TaxID=936130 RepID=UPI0022249D1B|nr:Vps5 C terminal like-domain-containing protein [Pisolithus orientalis]KAI5999338.1 Vps5 C terminal like-domain-containing protein [Pisolithus orientalis]
MDGFDDLLAQSSRNVLEDNPFANPFAQPRSSSPDPWASYAQAQQDLQPAHTQIDYFKSGFEEERSATPTNDSHFNGVEQSTQAAVDPLDAAAQTADDNEDERATGSTHVNSESDVPSRTPGFGTFVPTAGNDAKALGHAEPERQSPSRKHANTEMWTEDTPATTSPMLSSKKPSPASERAPETSLDRPRSPSLHQAFSAPEHLDEPRWHSAWEANGHTSALTTPSFAAAAATGADDDDDDDDTPIGQTAKFRSRSAERAAPVTRSDGSIPPLFVISVDDPQKVGDPIRQFIMYTVHTRTSSPLYSKSSFSVLRRYSDFLWLYETLSLNNPGVIVPPVPEKHTFGRFDAQFVQQRRLALEKCIQKIANHPVLAKDSDLKFFLESDTFALDVKHKKAESTHERGGLMASIGQTLTGPRFHETDEWFDKQRAYLDGLESQLRGLVKSIDIVAKQRAELSAATKEFAATVSELSTSELGPQLKRSLAALADVEHVVAEAQNTQSQQDVITLMSTADEYSRLIGSVRMAFNSRIRTYTNCQNADAEVRRARQMHDRAKAQGRLPTDRVGHTAERRALDAKHEFDQCSRLIKSEVARFEQERVEDFKTALQAFLDGMISRQRELIAAWENYQQLLLNRVLTSGQQGQEHGSLATTSA